MEGERTLVEAHVQLNVTGVDTSGKRADGAGSGNCMNRGLLGATSIARTAAGDDLAGSLRKIDAIREARDQLQSNVPPLTVFEALFVAMRDSTLVGVH